MSLLHVVRIVCLSVTLVGIVHAEELLQPVPAQPLASALESFAKQAGVQIVYGPEVAKGIQSPGASAGRSSREALEELLRGTGLTFEFVNEHTVTIVPVKSTAAMDDPLRLMQAQAVTGQSNAGAKPGHSTAADEQVESASAAQVQDKDHIQEIVVTAQKREEKLQEVPMSISVLSGVELDKSSAEGVTEVLNQVPGVAAVQFFQGGGTNVAVRGVTSAGPVFAGSSPISYYLDSVPFGLVRTAIAPDASAYDLQRVEVIRGPQGTLYGASAQNGVVRILTKDADLNEFGVKSRASLSSTEYGGENYRADAALNLPLVPGKLAARAVVGYQDSSGWVDSLRKSDANDSLIKTLRLKVNAQPTEQLSLGLSAWQSRADYGAPNMGDKNQRRDVLLDESISTDYDAYGLTIGYAFSSFAISSMTSYLDYSNSGGLDIIGSLPFSTGLYSDFDAEVFSQEITLHSTQDGSWRWSLGGMYRDAEDKTYQTLPDFFSGPLTDHTDASRSVAVFGELTRLILEGRLELTGGVRYFEDKVTGTEPSGFHSEQTFDAVSPRLVLSYHPSSNSTLYASYAEGFRSGFDQWASVIAADPNYPAVGPDTLKNYEIGAKGNMLGGRLDIQAAAYYIDWQDVQQQSTYILFGNFGVLTQINGKSASGMGFDFGLNAHPTDSLDLSVNVSWNDLAMDSDVYSGGALVYAAGDRLNFSPKTTVGASLGYSFPLGEHGFEGRFSASGNYTSSVGFRTDVSGSRVISSGRPIAIARASFSIQAPKNWEATLFADNINNEQDHIYGSPFLPIPSWNVRVRPRTVGLQLDFRY